MNTTRIFVLQFYNTARHRLVRLGSFVVLIFGLLAIAAGGFFWYPAYRDVSNLQKNIDERWKSSQQLSGEKEIAKAYARAREELAKIEPRLNANVKQARLIKSLAGLAKEVGVKITSEAYREGKTVEGYAALHHEVTLQGTYRSIDRFLRKIESLPSLTSVQELRMERARGQSRKLVAKVRMITFRRTAQIR